MAKRKRGFWDKRRKCDRVIFRKFPEGDVIALFPSQSEGPGLINSYQHTGQHGAASQQLIKALRPAKPFEYESLLQELRAIGYKPCMFYGRGVIPKTKK
jgi:hypothetical protein